MIHKVVHHRLNVGCGPFRAQDWTNTDLVRVEDIDPDVVVTMDEPFPFPPTSFNRVYMGHVLEHVPWAEVPAFFDKLRKVVTPDCELMVVGPDSHEVLKRWKNNEARWHDVNAILEGQGAYLEHMGEFVPIRWEQDRHHWNCYERRVMDVLEACGLENIRSYGRDKEGYLSWNIKDVDDWPLVSNSPNQFAVSATIP